MANRILKCYFCGEKDREDKIEVEYGKQKRRYHAKDCYNLYLKDQEFKSKEKQELDELVETIKKVHGIEIIPNQFFTHLQDIRNGNELFGRIGQKKSKEGYSYKVISETYKQCSNDINWAKNNKRFKGTLNFLLYTKAIIKDKIAGVGDAVKRKEEQAKEQKEREIDQSYDYGFVTYAHKEKEDEMDISDML